MEIVSAFDMMEVLVLLVAFFMGPTENDEGLFTFTTPTFSDKESCNQYVIENQETLYIYLSGQWKTFPDVYASQFDCMTAGEFKKFFGRVSKKDIAI